MTTIPSIIKHTGTIHHEHYSRKKIEHDAYNNENDSSRSIAIQNETSETSYACSDNNHDSVCDDNSADD